jgi:hypothetical protein
MKLNATLIRASFRKHGCNVRYSEFVTALSSLVRLRAPLLALVSFCLLALPAFAGGTAQLVEVVGFAEAGKGEHIFRFHDESKMARTLYVRYNGKRLSGVVSAKEHEEGVRQLQQQIAGSKTIQFGIMGTSSFGNFPKARGQLVCDALQFREGIIYAWPGKR